MKIGIVCFSQTGNTWKIAECISRGIADAGARCRLTRFEDVLPLELDAFDRVGIGCPVSGIDLDASPPRLQEPCIYCFNCVAECPEGAICADWGRLIARAPAYFERCRKELDRAAEKGEFRWLVDPDAVDPKDPYILQRLRSG